MVSEINMDSKEFLGMYSLGCKSFKGMTFSNLDLSNQKLDDVIFENCSFDNSNFEGAELSRCTMENCQFSICNLQKVNFLNGTFTQVNFGNSKLTFSVFNNSKIGGCHFHGVAICSNFYDCDIVLCDYSLADLRGVLFLNSRIYKNSFAVANLDKFTISDEEQTIIKPSAFEYCLFTESVFTGSDISNVVFSHSIFNK